MKTEHSPEPWQANQRLGEPFEIVATGGVIAHVFGHNVNGTLPKDANARRIVACVNACAGISTEELEHARFISNLLENESGNRYYLVQR